jgi:perosamine synthetase
VDSEDPAELCNMLGYNFRLGEIEAAIAGEQLKKLKGNLAGRQRTAAEFDAALAGLPGLVTPQVSAGCTHVYYIYGMTLDPARIGVRRERLVDALRAEGVPGLISGYQNVHLYPLFQQRIAYGTRGFPWTSPYCDRPVRYERGTCPVAERLHGETFLGISVCLNDYSMQDVRQVAGAFRKVWSQLDALRAAPERLAA